MDSKEQSLERFYRRGDDSKTGLDQCVHEVVERGGGGAFLSRMYDQVTAVLAARPTATVIPPPARSHRPTGR